ncbi:hypothetical protein GQR58_009279 [Nymphon striatum]|nr:hypothetical protein GQR58_009279 [Nymphon striatum]
MKSPIANYDLMDYRMASQKNDSVARVISAISLVLGILALIASIGVTPWIYFEASSAKQELSTKADSAQLQNMEDEIEILRNTIENLKSESANGIPNFPDLSKTMIFANETTSLNRAKRQAKKIDAPVESEYGSSVYIRWGRTKCGTSSVTIYAGVAAGGYSGHAGGGADYQCLPNDPEFGYVNPGLQYATGVGGSAMYGVEFKLNNIDPFDNKFNKGKTMNNEDSTCAACLAAGKSATMMIPAMTSCPQGWSLEYKGYLMAPHYKQHRMNYACVDEAPEPRNSGANTVGGLYWYPVEIVCGAIPCPQYVNGHECLQENQADSMYPSSNMKSPIANYDLMDYRMASQKTDSVARVISAISLVLGFLALIASVGVTPWIYFEASSAKQELSTKADSGQLQKIEDEIVILKNTIENFKSENIANEIPNFPKNSKTIFFANETTSLNRAKRQAQKSDTPVESEYGSSVYIRWGRTKCGTFSVTIYSGIAAGGYSGHTGGGASYQCLPNDPEFGYVNPGLQYATVVGGSAMYGVEFKLNNIDPFDNKFNKGKSLNMADATCAACLAPGKSATIMIPAMTSCPQGWSLEYKGYLMAPNYKQRRMNYACVDEAPEPNKSGVNTAGGLWWQPVEIVCGAIPCPQYVNGHEVSCVVCSR